MARFEVHGKCSSTVLDLECSEKRNEQNKLEIQIQDHLIYFRVEILTIKSRKFNESFQTFFNLPPDDTPQFQKQVIWLSLTLSARMDRNIASIMSHELRVHADFITALVNAFVILMTNVLCFLCLAEK